LLTGKEGQLMALAPILRNRQKGTIRKGDIGKQHIPRKSETASVKKPRI
jgi:hypothetical protein